MKMIVVPKAVQLKQEISVAEAFFELTIGHESASRVLSGLMAFSSLGNIIVQTFTAARGSSIQDSQNVVRG
jgi:hypothetical protein